MRGRGEGGKCSAALALHSGAGVPFYSPSKTFLLRVRASDFPPRQNEAHMFLLLFPNRGEEVFPLLQLAPSLAGQSRGGAATLHQRARRPLSRFTFPSLPSPFFFCYISSVLTRNPSLSVSLPPPFQVLALPLSFRLTCFLAPLVH